MKRVTASTARVATDRPKRYGKQLASHFSHRIETVWDNEAGSGTLKFTNPDLPFQGEVELVADESGVLLLHLEVPDDAPSGALGGLEDVVGSHLVRFGKNDGLEVSWRRAGGKPGLHIAVEEE